MVCSCSRTSVTKLRYASKWPMRATAHLEQVCGSAYGSSGTSMALFKIEQREAIPSSGSFAVYINCMYDLARCFALLSAFLSLAAYAQEPTKAASGDFYRNEALVFELFETRML